MEIEQSEIRPGRIEYTNDAAEALSALVSFIEAYNTKGAGLRWLKK